MNDLMLGAGSMELAPNVTCAAARLPTGEIFVYIEKDGERRGFKAPDPAWFIEDPDKFEHCWRLLLEQCGISTWNRAAEQARRGIRNALNIADARDV